MLEAHPRVAVAYSELYMMEADGGDEVTPPRSRLNRDPKRMDKAVRSRRILRDDTYVWPEQERENSARKRRIGKIVEVPRPLLGAAVLCGTLSRSTPCHALISIVDRAISPSET